MDGGVGVAVTTLTLPDISFLNLTTNFDITMYKICSELKNSY